MFTRVAVIALLAVESTMAIRKFKPIDWEHFEHHEQKPVQMEMKTFTEDGFDPISAILAEGEKDAKEFDTGREAMDKKFDDIRQMASSGPVQKLDDLKKFVPRLKKIDVSGSD